MSENPKNDDAEKPTEMADKPQPGDEFDKARAGMMEKAAAVDAVNPANARKALREQLKEFERAKQEVGAEGRS